jgi:hypothetical protein
VCIKVWVGAWDPKIMGQRQLLGQLLGMITSLLAVFGLFRCTIASSTEPISVFQTVYSQCILIIVSLFYYGIAKVCLILIRPGRNRYLVPVEPSASRAPPMGLNLSLPRLTIQNVWILVYGLGFVFFITGYCFLGLHPICLAFTGLAMGVLGVDELVCPRTQLMRLYTSLRLLTLLLAVIALVLVSADLLDSMVIKYVSTLDIYSIFFGLVFPFGSQFILIIIRDSRRYTLGTVVEVCEFGFPFTVFLGIFHLCVAYGQRFQSDSDSLSGFQGLLFNSSSGELKNWYQYNHQLFDRVVETNGASLLFYSLTPLLMVPALVCYMSCVLDGCAVDPLIALTFSLCVEHLATRPASSSLGIGGMVLVSLALVLRVLCEYRPNLVRDPYFTQGQSDLLPHTIVWSRASREREAEVEALTNDLQVETVH